MGTLQYVSEGRCVSALLTSKPGERCDKQGQICLGGSYCNQDRICTCPANQLDFNNRCRPTSAPGDSCAQDQLCLGGSTCQNGRCQCPIGRIPNGQDCKSNGTIVVPPGGACNRPNSICVEFSHCNPSFICQCHSGYQYENEKCIRIAAIGENCSNGVQCTSGASCSPELICRCLPGLATYNGQCVRPAHPGQSCGFGEFCAGGSICDALSKICVCPVGSTLTNSICTTEADPGQSCADGEKCIGLSYCDPVRQLCTCNAGSVIANGQCVEPLPVGAACSQGQNCVENAICLSLTCRCKPGYCRNSKIRLGVKNFAPKFLFLHKISF